MTSAAESCWASNTGVQGGTGYTEAQIEAGAPGFTHVTGDVTVTTAGATIDHEWISGCVAVDANNVTIKDSLIASQDTCHGGNAGALGGGINDGSGSSPTGLLIEYTTVDGQNINTDASGIAAASYTCDHCNVFGYTHNYTPGSSATIEDSYGHDLTSGASGSHEEDVYADSSTNITVEHSYLVASGGNGYVTGAIFNGNTYNAANGLTVANSYLEGTTSGFDIEIGCSNANIHVTNTAFSSDAKSNGTEAGPGNWSWSANGNLWSGNYDSATQASISPLGSSCG